MDRLVLGLVPSDRLRARDPRTRAFTRALGDRAGVLIVERNVSTYDELEHEMTLGRIDVAWLPPIVFARLERAAVAVALATPARMSQAYCSVLVAARGSRVVGLGDLERRRVAWVDPLSASGYVVARLGLSAAGIDPRTVIAHETSAAAHAEAMRAVLEGRADVAATFAHLDAAGRIVRGAWSELGASNEEVQVVAILGEVPPDLVATHAAVPEALAQALASALLAMADDAPQGPMLDGIFGGRRFERGTTASYHALRDLIERASNAGIGGASAAYVSTAPPDAG
jgi:ABC-type phosphate/phosphonate transport system substrate-binding protein